MLALGDHQALMSRQQQSDIVLARIESRAEFVEKRAEKLRWLRQMKSRDVAVAARKAVKAVEAALEVKVDRQVPIQSFLELQQRDIVTCVQPHTLFAGRVGRSRKSGKFLAKAVEGLIDARIEPIADFGEARAKGRSSPVPWPRVRIASLWPVIASQRPSSPQACRYEIPTSRIA